MIDTDSDINLTGSNVYMLSSELSTYLTGGQLSIEISPLSFNKI